MILKGGQALGRRPAQAGWGTRMKRLGMLGLFTVMAGCAAPGEFVSLLPIFRADPPRLDRPAADPDQLAGADQGQVTRLLGTPELVRRDGPAEIWHYSGDACRVLVFLYRDDEPGSPKAARPADAAPHVRHVAVWPSAAEPKPCLASVASRLKVVPAALN